LVPCQPPWYLPSTCPSPNLWPTEMSPGIATCPLGWVAKEEADGVMNYIRMFHNDRLHVWHYSWEITWPGAIVLSVSLRACPLR
jgi:hypothetical protein